MNKQEIIQALEKAKRQLSVAKEQDEKDFAKKKIDKLENQLAELQAKEDMEDKPKAKVVTDQQDVQRIKNSINEGELILRTGKFNGKKKSEDELSGILNSVNSSRRKIGMPEVSMEDFKSETKPKKEKKAKKEDIINQANEVFGKEGFYAKVSDLSNDNDMSKYMIEPTGYKKDDKYDGMQILFEGNTYEVAELQAGKNEDEIHIFGEYKSLSKALESFMKGNKRKPIKIVGDKEEPKAKKDKSDKMSIPECDELVKKWTDAYKKRQANKDKPKPTPSEKFEKKAESSANAVVSSVKGSDKEIKAEVKKDVKVIIKGLLSGFKTILMNEDEDTLKSFNKELEALIKKYKK